MLSHESSLLTTINTPFGRYRYFFLLFVLKKAQNIFQQKIDECFESTSRVADIVDNRLVYFMAPQAQKKINWTVIISHESSLLTIFNTPLGRYRYFCLPFGLLKFTNIDECFERMPRVGDVVDDILVYCKMPQGHSKNLCFEETDNVFSARKIF